MGMWAGALYSLSRREAVRVILIDPETGVLKVAADPRRQHYALVW